MKTSEISSLSRRSKATHRCLFLVAFVLVASIDALRAATYYVDYVSGIDSNLGTKSSPWKLCPTMPGFSGTYVPQTGDRFVFKGGVTWPATALPVTVTKGGSGAAAKEYYGVDNSWFSGAAWSRPIFDCEYARADAFDLQVGSVHIDGIELKRSLCGINFGIGLIHSWNALSDVLISNCYIHGWRTSAATDDAHGGIIFWQFSGSGIQSIVVDGCEIENSENQGAWNGVCVRSVGVIRNSKIHHNSSAVLFCLDFDNNQLYSISYPVGGFDGVYHPNGVYLDPVTLGKNVGFIRNSRFFDVGGGANMAYANPRFSKIYIYNNIFYGAMSAQRAIAIDPYDYGANQNSGEVYCFNNTIVNPDGGVPGIHIADRGGLPKLGVLVATNNHVIGVNASVHDGWGQTVASIVGSNNLVSSPTQATSDGYVLANLYRPTASTSPTVDKGTNNVLGLFSTDVAGVQRPQSASWDIGAYEWSAGGVVIMPPVNPPVTLPGLVADGSAGVISGPFVVQGQGVSQAIQTVNPSEGGLAAYAFGNVPAGDYILSCQTIAPSEGENSFFINIDSEPVAPEMIWDIPVTSGAEERRVSWRGTGSIQAPQFSPKVFRLSAGEHQVVVRGREANATLLQIRLIRLPEPPKNAASGP